MPLVRISIKTLRILAFYGMHLLYFPLLIIALRLYTYTRLAFGFDPAPWLNGLLSFLIAGIMYAALGYSLVRWLNRLEKKD